LIYLGKRRKFGGESKENGKRRENNLKKWEEEGASYRIESKDH
jgi:hypothetical protein